MQIRSFQVQDAEAIAQLFHDTVREINCRDYSATQVKAWAPDNLYFRNWVEECASRITYVAELKGLILGFAELERSGHINCFYVHKDYQRCGVGKRLYQAIEAKAFDLGITNLTTEASITAKPFFQRVGFSVIKAQEVMRRDETFLNYVMQKWL